MKKEKNQKREWKQGLALSVLVALLLSACGQEDELLVSEVSSEGEIAEVSGSFVLDATVEIELPRARTGTVPLSSGIASVDLSLVESDADVLVKPVVVDVGPKGFVFVEKYLDELPAGLVRLKKTSSRDSLRFSASYDATQFSKISGGIGFVLLNPGNKKISIKADPNKKGKRVVNTQDKKVLVKETVVFNNFKSFLNSMNGRSKSTQSFSPEGKAEVVAATIHYIQKKSQDAVTDEDLQALSSEVSQEDVSEADAIFDLCEKVDQMATEQMSSEKMAAISGKISEDYDGFLQSIQPYVIEEEIAPVLTQQSAPTEILAEPVISEEILVADRSTESSLETSVSSDAVVVVEPLLDSEVVVEPVIAESVVVVEEVIEPVVVAEVALVTEPVVESISEPVVESVLEPVVISDPEPGAEVVSDSSGSEPAVEPSFDDDDDEEDNDEDDDEDDDDSKKDKKSKKKKKDD